MSLYLFSRRVDWVDWDAHGLCIEVVHLLVSQATVPLSVAAVDELCSDAEKKYN